MYSEKWLEKPIKGVLCDISGVLKDTNTKPICGSVMGFEILKELGIPFKLLTNETTETKKQLVCSLTKLGFKVTEEDIISPIPVMVKILQDSNMRPFLLVHNDVLGDFKSLNQANHNCVVIADAGSNFSYENLNTAFRLLMNMPEPRLFSLGNGKYYKGQTGLHLDVGTYGHSLQFATGVKPIIIGKPSREYFLSAVKEMNLEPEDVIMIGDDLENDVKGAQACGIRGILVQTGKYRYFDGASLAADGVVRNLYEAMQLIAGYSPKV